MAFKGLFIGIDRYASPDIGELSCARRDAVALHALFKDTLGGESRLLLDDQATRRGIQEQFDSLAQCDPDDVVVIAYSGHGSQTHELATHDADLRALSRTAIPLDELAGWFARIPARQVVFIMDCCFSGGIGSKVLQTDSKPRNMRSVESKLAQMAGTGRLIFTASTASEPAWENSTYGHGFLTYFVIEALQGPEEVSDGGSVPVYRLLEYVTRRVIEAASKIGEPQHPTLRGQLDGELLWPIFVPGANYARAFPERGLQPVTTDLQSLMGYGFPQDLIEAWGREIPSLNALQVDAINEFGLLRGDHLVVSAPTSSGKTMVGELAALRGVLDRKRAIFLLPLKALVNDKHRQFLRTYGPYGIRTIRATGESSDDVPALLKGQYDICLLTYEKFTALALNNPYILAQVGTIVVDEVQMIADQSRGSNLEFILTLIRMRARAGLEPQLVALSAVIGHTNGLEGWLGGRLLRRTERPVPLDEGILRADGSFRFVPSDGGQEDTVRGAVQREFRKNSSQDYIVPLVRNLVADGKQVIVFRETKGEARGCAGYLAEALALAPALDAIQRLPSSDGSLASRKLRETLAGGVAFHISDLDRVERRVVEEGFRSRDSRIRVIVATTTLAMGVNTPAEAVVIAGLSHPGDEPYTVAEYKNIVGRAGRAGYAPRGTSYLLALTPAEERDLWDRYVLGEPEDLASRFMSGGTDPRSLVMRVVGATGRVRAGGMNTEEIADFLDASFGAFQAARGDLGWKWDRESLGASISELAANGLLEVAGDGGVGLTALGRLCGQSGLEVESVIRIVRALRSVHPSELNDPTLIAAAQLTVEVDDVYFPMNKKSTLKEPAAWNGELARQGVTQGIRSHLGRNVREQHVPTLRAKKAVACLLWMSDQPLERIEATLTQYGRPDGAAGAVRGVTSRTFDVLPTVIGIAGLVHEGLDLSVRAPKLLARLEVGVPSSLAALASALGPRLSRGDYLRLAAHGLSDLGAIEACPDQNLAEILGNDEEKLEALSHAIAALVRQRENETQVIVQLPMYEE